MAKGLAVIKGKNTVVFKALEDGTIHLGSAAQEASVELKGSLKLDIGSQADGYFLKTDVDGNASWAQIAMSDVSSLEDEISNINGLLAANVAELSQDLSDEVARATAAEAAISQDLSDEESRALAAEAALDGRLTTAEGEIDQLQTDLDSLESQFSILTGDFDAGNVLSNLQAIQEYLDGDDVDVGGVLSDIGDLTSFTRELSTIVGELSVTAAGDEALNAEISRAQAAEAELSQDISDEESRAIAAEAELSQDISDEETRALAAEAELSQDISDEESRAIAAEGELSQDISDLASSVANNLSNSVVDVTGTAAEVEVTVTENESGRTVVVGLPDDVSIAQSLDVGGDVTLGNSPTDDSVVVNGNFRIPHMTRAQALTVYGDGSALNDQATTIANGHDGHMFYLNDDNAANDSDPFPEGKKWYFCENGVWHASFFYYA